MGTCCFQRKTIKVVIELGHSFLVGYMDNLTFACVKV